MQHHIDFTVPLLCWNTNTKVLLRNANPGLQNHYMYEMPSSFRSGNGFISYSSHLEFTVLPESKTPCVTNSKNLKG